jgi:hypothetical protein
MALAECLITSVHAQRVMIPARTVILDLSVTPQYRERIHIQFTDVVKMDKKKKFTNMTLTIDGSCLTTRISSICSISTLILKHVGASR